MSHRPFYTSSAILRPAYQLRFSWTCWPSAGTCLPPTGDEVLARVGHSWEADGIRMLQVAWKPASIQMTVSIQPHLSPVFLTARLKGRLQHALRQDGMPVRLSRKVSLRSLGDATRSAVERYIRDQVQEACYVDPRNAAKLAPFTTADPAADLSTPTNTNSGQYLYNLHLVLVTEGRHVCSDRERLAVLHDGCLRIAARKGHTISVLSVMPEHLHLSLRANIAHSPDETALAYMNNLAYLSGSKPIWQLGYYVGTFGEYTMRAVRR